MGISEFFKELGAQFKDFFNPQTLASLVQPEKIIKFAAGLVVIILFFIIYKLIRLGLKKGAAKKFSPKTVNIFLRIFKYLFYFFIVVHVLKLFGIKLSAVWGAAGVAGVAIGFAAQTSVSNIISGIFVVTDKALKIGDLIEIGGELGTVEHVGLLAIKIKTLDGQIIRIPNSTIIDTNLKNYSTLTKRRWIFDVSLDYGTDMKKALEVLSSVPSRCANVLKDPAPGVFYDGFGDSGIVVKFAVWFDAVDLVTVKNQMYCAIHEVCKENNINIPFNRMDVTLLDENTIPKKSSK